MIDSDIELFSVAEVAEILGVCRDFVYDEIKRGRLIATNLARPGVKRKLRVMHSDLAAYLREQRMPLAG